MQGKLILVTVILAAVAVLSGHLSGYLARRGRRSRSAFYMAFAMGATAWWAGWNALEYLAPGLSTKIVYANLQYLAISTIAVSWFAFGASFHREEQGTAPKHAHPLLWLIPAATSVFVWLDPSWGLVRRSFRLETQAGILVLAKEFGLWFWVHSAYSYVLIVLGTVLILRGLHASRGTRKAQRITLVAGSLLPTVTNLLYISGLLALGSIDPTPLAFSVTGVLLVINLSRYRLLSLVTVAQATAVEQLPEAVLVMDPHGDLAYANSTARTTFGIRSTDVGKKRTELGPPLDTHLDGSDPSGVIEVAHGQRRYEFRSGIILRRGRPVGSVVTLFDVTRRVTAEEALKKTNLLLESGLTERTKALEGTNQRLTEELEYRTRAEKQLYHDALHDPLTGLPNRSLALGRIEQFIARGRRDSTLSFGVLYMDFEGFKYINDNYGHSVGDSFLCEVSSRLKRCVREVDLVARVGPDEFVVLLDGPGVEPNYEEIADRIADNLSVPWAFGPNTVIPSASIGILVGSPDYRDPAQVLHDADIAMRRARSDGRSRRVVFSEDMRQKAHEHGMLSAALRSAVASGGISLAFQPIVHMDGRRAGWEVLARWRHERLGAIGPDRFIPLAEETGLIVPLGTYVLLEALKVASSLRSSGLLEDTAKETAFFSINVSAIQLGQSGFEELVLSSVDRLGLPRSVLHLELTESAIMENRDTATHVIESLSAEGIRFALDDFGTGYSSLGYLHRIPIHSVKIDRSFILRMDPATPVEAAAFGVVRGIISLAHELHKDVVAEGIETEATAQTLRSYDCDFAQGYLFGKPMDAAALAAMLAQERASQ